MASMGPVQRYESLYMGADEFLNQRVNEELQRAFEAGIPSSEVYPSAEVYHIGTPSERPTSEGFRSALSHGTSSVPSHPTSSPSFVWTFDSSSVGKCSTCKIAELSWRDVGCCRHFDTARTSFKGSSKVYRILWSTFE